MTGSRSQACALDRVSPQVLIAFFAGTFVTCMVLRHPAYLAATLLASATLRVSMWGMRGLRFVVALVPVFVIVTAVNPLVNTAGDTVLFYSFRDRPYTLEALWYGAAIAAMFVSMLIWFSNFNRVLTPDKLAALLGSRIPSTSMVLIIALRFVPALRHAWHEMTQSLEVLSGEEKKGIRGVKLAIALLPALLSRAFEGGLITADSMSARGYGIGSRSNFAQTNMPVYDRNLLLLLGSCFVCALACVLSGRAAVEFIPSFSFAAFDLFGIFGFTAYCAFLLIPTIVNFWESLLWHISLSRI